MQFSLMKCVECNIIECNFVECNIIERSELQEALYLIKKRCEAVKKDVSIKLIRYLLCII